jgi:hypothetical protein
MAENKTKAEKFSVIDFIDSIDDETKRADSKTLVKLMKDISGAKPVMWGIAIIGFGNTHYAYESGREGDWFAIGFSPRKANLSLYLKKGFPEYEKLLAKLGKYKMGKGCLYINKLEQVDMNVLSELIRLSHAHALKS